MSAATKELLDTLLFLLCMAGGGGLVGYGHFGTAQGACLGAGTGLLATVALYILSRMTP